MRFGFFFVGFWTLIVGIFDVFIGYGIWGQMQARSWPHTSGAITRSDIRTSTDDDGTTYHPEIEFTYTVEGTTYTGDKHRFTAFGSSDQSFARSVVERYPVGREVYVYYDPGKPSRSVLETGVASSDLVIALFLTPFNVVMIGGWLLLGRAVRYRVTKPPAGGVPIRKRGMHTHLRLPRLSPLAAALATALGVSFISVFIVVFGFGMEPPMWVLGTTWTIVFGLAAAVFFWRTFVVGSGRKDLVIDDEHSMLSLPQTFGRDEDILVPAEAVTGIDVERIVHSSKNGTSYTWAPRLQWRGDDGDARHEKLAEWHSKDRAQDFAAWLRERLGADGKEAAAGQSAPDRPLLDL